MNTPRFPHAETREKIRPPETLNTEQGQGKARQGKARQE
jgi:hypothetical protein